MKKKLVACKWVVVDVEVYARLRRAKGAVSLNNALRKLLGMPPSGVRPGAPGGRRKQPAVRSSGVRG